MCSVLTSVFSVCIMSIIMSGQCLTSNKTTNTTTGGQDDDTWDAQCPQDCQCYHGIPSVQVFSHCLHVNNLLKIVNCSSAGHVAMPTQMPAEAEVLIFSGNMLSGLNKLPFLPNVRYLDLSNSSIQALDNSPVFASFSNLKCLKLNNNNITAINQETFQGIIQLEHLDLGNNQLDNISLKAFSGLSNLQSLCLHSNRLSVMNYSWFQDITEARQLDLSNNQLIFINAKDFYPLHKLNLLNLSSNHISTIDTAAFTSLRELIILDLTSNDLISIPSAQLRRCTVVKKVTLDKNPIIKIKPNDFSNMSFSHLSISYMPNLTVIEKHSFINLPNLVDLKMHNNPKLIYIDSQAFANIPKLNKLYIYSNQLTALSPNIMAAGPNLAEIHLYHNPLRCDCNAFWVREIIEEARDHNRSRPSFNHSEFIKCDYPLNLTGISIGDIDEDQFPRICSPTTLSSFTENYTLDLGEELRLECHTFGIPEPKLSWLLPNGSELSGNVHSDKVEIMDNCILVIRHLTVEDSGTYACKSTNTAGYDLSSTRIIVTNKPVRLVPFTVSNDYISISWNGTKHRSMISDYQLHYRETLPNDSRAELLHYKVIPLGSHYHSYTVTKLKPNTFYEFCIVYVYDTELYKVDCVTIRTKVLSSYKKGVKKIISEKIIAGVCTAIGLVLAIACMVTLVKKFRFNKEYDSRYDADESETINIPLENMYQPLNSQRCSSKTSLLSVTTQPPGFDEY